MSRFSVSTDSHAHTRIRLSPPLHPFQCILANHTASQRVLSDRSAELNDQKCQASQRLANITSVLQSVGASISSVLQSNDENVIADSAPASTFETTTARSSSLSGSGAAAADTARTAPRTSKSDSITHAPSRRRGCARSTTRPTRGGDEHPPSRVTEVIVPAPDLTEAFFQFIHPSMGSTPSPAPPTIITSEFSREDDPPTRTPRKRKSKKERASKLITPTLMQRVALDGAVGTITSLYADQTIEVTWDDLTRSVHLATTPQVDGLVFLETSFQKEFGRVRIRKRKSTGRGNLSAFAYMKAPSSPSGRREVGCGKHLDYHSAVKAILHKHKTEAAAKPPRSKKVSPTITASVGSASGKVGRPKAKKATAIADSAETRKRLRSKIQADMAIKSGANQESEALYVPPPRFACENERVYW
jgi:hypothetical protein